MVAPSGHLNMGHQLPADLPKKHASLLIWGTSKNIQTKSVQDKRDKWSYYCFLLSFSIFLGGCYNVALRKDISQERYQRMYPWPRQNWSSTPIGASKISFVGKGISGQSQCFQVRFIRTLAGAAPKKNDSAESLILRETWLKFTFLGLHGVRFTTIVAEICSLLSLAQCKRSRNSHFSKCFTTCQI